MNLDERLHGYRDAVAASPGIKMDQIVDVKGDPRMAFDTTTELLAKNAKVDAFVCARSIPRARK